MWIGLRVVILRLGADSYEVSTVLFRELYRIIPGWPQTELAPASWQPCSLARVGHFGGVLRLRSSAWDRPRTPSRTSAAAGLAWLVGRFAGAHRAAAGYGGLQRDRRGDPDRRQGRAATFGHQASRRGQRSGPARQSVAAAAICDRDEAGLARGAGAGSEGAHDQVRTRFPLPIASGCLYYNILLY